MHPTHVKFLLRIKAIFRKIGIEIAFVKKQKSISPLQHNTEESMNSFWSEKKNEKNWKNPELFKFYKLVINLVKEKGFDLNSRTILDAGCGTGSLLIFINDSATPKECFGYEFSKKAIEIAKDRFPQASYFYKNLNDQPDRKFDFIFCTEVLEHIIDPHIPLQNLINMMEPSGGLFITVPNGRIDNFEGHINFWSPESWDAFIRNYSNGRSFETGEIPPYGLYALIKA